jgi:hypothetical protein
MKKQSNIVVHLPIGRLKMAFKTSVLEIRVFSTYNVDRLIDGV